MSKRKAPQESMNEGITDFLVGTWRGASLAAGANSSLAYQLDCF